MMSIAVPPGCGFEIFALGCGARGASCAGGVLAVSGCSGSRIVKLSVFAGGLGSATSGFGGNGFGANAMPNDSCSALASPIVRGGDASGAGAEVAGSLVASATGGGAVDGDHAAAVAGASCIRVAAVRGSLGLGE